MHGPNLPANDPDRHRKYIGTSLEAVSRSLRALAGRGIIAFRNRHYLRIIDRTALAAVIAEN